ncbi:Lrp/AsnC family transcriptional regulator [Marinobacter adhaerens]|jgi:Lrp/AsnC family transcriptional regulator|nr:Lrp/AsnC family transcriptional regulator [Marinobacter adhaerens]QWV13875.1 Lrp/AsnC family transcriptional regulator [Marinobacter adhaerens]|tara:strand:- start:1563 stop:2015 length:453 start_codon:yes stop_codon:yes gene_type:complete
MDTTDLKILRFLQDRPEASVSYLAEKIGLSQTPCWRRIKKLEDDGVISGRAVILDPKSLGIVIDVVAHLKVARQEEETLEALEAEVQTHPEIVECFSMSGESDYMLRVMARSIEDYENFLKKTLVHLPGVTGVNSSFVLKRVKLTTDLPI